MSDLDIVFSDEETPDVSEWRTFKLVFGKHKNVTLSTMMCRGETRHYLKHLLNWPKLRDDTRANIETALSHCEKMLRKRR